PTSTPTTSPTLAPSKTPTSGPSATPTDAPSSSPTGIPTSQPSKSPTLSPTVAPTNGPTTDPTSQPTYSPTTTPSYQPTNSQIKPTSMPSPSLTSTPTACPVQGIDAIDDTDPSTYTNAPLVVHILDNDKDANSTISVIDIPTAASEGTCSIVFGGKAITYTPNEAFTGVDQCDYMICDEQEECCDTATLTISVMPPATNAPTTKPTPCPPGEEPTTEPTPSSSPATPGPIVSPTDVPSESPSWPYPCGILPCDRARDLKEFYSTMVSDPALFDNPSSPQSLALDWITNHDKMMICPNDPNTCHTIQRYVLAVFYFSTQGFQWTSCSAPKDYQCEEEISKANNDCDIVVTRHYSNDRISSLDTNAWLTPAHECSWGGVACHGQNAPELTSCLDQIDFEANNLRGIIPDEIASIENMRYIYLKQGLISGAIPSALGSLDYLQVIDLQRNNFSGSIPVEIYNLSNLLQLDLDSNKLSGTISTHIGNLGSLNLLRLENNLLQGTIPTEVGQLDQLRKVYLSFNNFTGQVEPEICALRPPEGSLEKLQVDCLAEVSCNCCTSCS
ncbi:hypothetical protein ACHAXR_004026, partial [Thalassiosira sp. AJA248-18]